MVNSGRIRLAGLLRHLSITILAMHNSIFIFCFIQNILSQRSPEEAGALFAGGRRAAFGPISLRTGRIFLAVAAFLIAAAIRAALRLFIAAACCVVNRNAYGNHHGCDSGDGRLKVVTEGGPAVGKSPLMPSYKGIMNTKQIQSVVRYVKALRAP